MLKTVLNAFPFHYTVEPILGSLFFRNSSVLQVRKCHIIITLSLPIIIDFGIAIHILTKVNSYLCSLHDARARCTDDNNFTDLTAKLNYDNLLREKSGPKMEVNHKLTRP